MVFIFYPFGCDGDMLLNLLDLWWCGVGSKFFVLVFTAVENGLEIVFHLVDHTHPYVLLLHLLLFLLYLFPLLL